MDISAGVGRARGGQGRLQNHGPSLTRLAHRYGRSSWPDQTKTEHLANEVLPPAPLACYILATRGLEKL